MIENSRKICSAYFTFVVNKCDKQQTSNESLYTINPVTEEDKRRYQMAIERRNIRLGRKKLIQNVHERYL